MGHKFHNLEMSSPKSIMCARDIDFVSGSTTFWLDYWTVRTVWYCFISILFINAENIKITTQNNKIE
jgi:hypothetical protein